MVPKKRSSEKLWVLEKRQEISSQIKFYSIHLHSLSIKKKNDRTVRQVWRLWQSFVY